MLDEGRLGPADRLGQPREARLGGLIIIDGGGLPVEILERNERRGAGASAGQIIHGGARVLEAVHDDPLQALAEHGRHRALEPRRHVQQIGDRAAHAGEPGARFEHRADAGPVALARGLERAERLELGASRYVRESRVAERHLRAGQLGLARGERAVQPLALDAERGQRGERPAVRRLDGRPLGGELQRLGLGGCALLRQPLGPSRQLRAALAELAGLTDEIHTLAGDSHLLESQRLEPVPVAAEGPAMTLKGPLEVTRDGGALGRHPLGLVQRRTRRLALAHDRVETLSGRADLLVQAHRLLAQLPHLHAHLLAPLEQPLQLALHLLHTLAQVGQGMVAGLDDLALARLARGERRGARALRLLGLAQRLKLGRKLRGLRGQGRVVGGHEAQRQVAPLVLQRFVLLRLLRLALERAQLAPDLVHHVAHTHEVLARLLELALGLVALLLVARDARRLFDEDAALVRLGGQDVVELVLIHHGIGARVGAGAGKEVEDVAQAGRSAVQQVLALARAVELACDGDLAPRHRQRAVVAEQQLDLGEADGLARRRAVKDEVFHPLTAQRLGALLAEGPAHGLAYIALPAAVRADDRGDAGQHRDGRLLGERLEAVQRNRL